MKQQTWVLKLDQEWLFNSDGDVMIIANCRQQLTKLACFFFFIRGDDYRLVASLGLYLSSGKAWGIFVHNNSYDLLITVIELLLT